MARKRIPVSGPSITQLEVDCVAEAAREAWYENHNRYHVRFEEAFAEYLGVRHAMALPSCTSAIHLSLLALGVGPGDEVVVPDVTWIASAAPVTYVGATPVFADIDASTWCMSAASLEACITPRTRAAIPVDLYGGVPDWDALRAVSKRRGVAIIEDAAEAVGSEYRGRKAGTFGETGVFSFHGSKTLTTGEGGLLATDRTDLYERAAVLRDHGRPPGDRAFYNTEVAHKYKMSALQAALGWAQLQRIEELVARKRKIFGWYREELGVVPGVTLNAEPPGTKNSYWMVTVVVDSACGVMKGELIARLDAAGIDCRPFFHPLSSLPAYAGLPHAADARRRNTVGYRVSRAAVNLPSGLNLTRDDVAYVAASLKKALSRTVEK
ncbi:MAG: DegT/DnrJ/EryC1/StrS family aminotransferase [Betaproteobacteria bacterium]|nr:DegT/DnrJ/EryC1/StrS family aminotransferase [Betaproteobacteria bacterium]